MRKFGTLVATAAAALVCFANSNAFADLIFVRATETGSYELDLALNNGTFNNLHVTVPAAFSGIGFPQIQGGTPTFSGQLEPSAVTTPVNSTFSVPLDNVAAVSEEEAAGWGGAGNYTLTGTTDLVASGGTFAASSSTPFDFGLKFGNTISDGTTFDIVFRNGTQFVRGFHVSYYKEGGITGVDRLALVEFVIPTPSAAWAGLAMLGGMGAFLVKRRRNRVVID